MLRTLWLAQDARPRIGWRILLVVIAYLMAAGAGQFARGALGHLHAPWALRGAALAVVTIGLFRALLLPLRRKVDRRPDAGLRLPGWRDLGSALSGAFVGVLMLLAVFGLQLALGWLRIDGPAVARSPLAAVDAALGALGLFIAVGYSEEAMMRGAILQNLGEALAFPWAVAATGMIFGLLHLLGGMITPSFVIASLAITGFLAVARQLTGNLAWAMGWHCAWDWTQTLLGLSPDSTTLVHLTRSGPIFWMGVPPFVEGGALYLGECLLGLGFILLIARRRGLPLGARLTPEGELAHPASVQPLGEPGGTPT